MDALITPAFLYFTSILPFTESGKEKNMQVWSVCPHRADARILALYVFVHDIHGHCLVTTKNELDNIAIVVHILKTFVPAIFIFFLSMLLHAY